MTKVHTHVHELVDYLLPVESDEIIFDILDDPRMLTPYRTVRENGQQYLVYRPTSFGKTLRSYMTDVNKLRKFTTFRTSFTKRATLSHIELLLKLIEIYEFVLSKNRLLSPSHINPDLVWIDYDELGGIRVQILDLVNSNPVYDHNEKLYWSPEMLSKYTAVTYYNVDRQLSLKRCDTRPSTMSTVYSLGLLLYFIISAEDPFVGSRVNVNERPPSLLWINPTYGRLIFIATHHDPKQRPTLSEWRDTILSLTSPVKNKCCLF
jgi:hypothetical protein